QGTLAGLAQGERESLGGFAFGASFLGHVLSPSCGWERTNVGGWDSDRGGRIKKKPTLPVVRKGAVAQITWSPQKRCQSSMKSRRSCETRPAVSPCLSATSIVRSPRIKSSMTRLSRSVRVLTQVEKSRRKAT